MAWLVRYWVVAAVKLKFLVNQSVSLQGGRVESSTKRMASLQFALGDLGVESLAARSVASASLLLPTWLESEPIGLEKVVASLFASSLMSEGADCREMSKIPEVVCAVLPGIQTDKVAASVDVNGHLLKVRVSPSLLSKWNAANPPLSYLSRISF